MSRFFVIFSLVFLIGLSPAKAETVSIDPPADPVVVAAPSVAITLTPNPTSVTTGDVVTYTVTITNNGDTPFTNLGVTFDRPVGFSYTDGTPADPLKNLGTLTPGTTITKTFRLSVGPKAPTGRVPLEVLVGAKEFDLNETVAVVNVRAGQVLGAATLVDTGTSMIPMIALGVLLAAAGAYLLRRWSKT